MTPHSMRTLFIALSILLTIGAGAAAADAVPHGSLDLQRSVQFAEFSAGETVSILFEITNYDSVEIEYTLIEEIPFEWAVLESGNGSYNQTAGFIVWRGSIAPDEQQAFTYVAQIKEEAQVSILLYAYLSSSQGEVLESMHQLEVSRVPLELSLDTTLVQIGEETTLRLQVQNPLNRPLHVDLDVQVAAGLDLAEELPNSLELAAGEVWTFATPVTATDPGSYTISVVPTIENVAAGGREQVTLSLYDGELPRPPKDAEDEPIQKQPVTTERFHQMRLPPHLLDNDDTLLFVARIPAGAGYLPGSAFVNAATAVEPQLSGDYLLFPLPSLEEIEVRYALRYEDQGMVADSAAHTEVGLISLGVIPRLLQGDESLLQLLHAESFVPPRERRGVVILDPSPGQVFTEREQIDIEIDAPTGAQVTLHVNGEAVPPSKVGAIAADDALGRYAQKYIALPLQAGANRLTAEAITPDGDVFNDEIFVYRSGPVAHLYIDPVTELATGRVHPLLVQISATDQDGLPPADGTPITVEVTGGKLLSEDAHPDWVGHQILLYGGRAFLKIEPPFEAVALLIQASLGELSVQENLIVTARADSWFAIGYGTARVTGLYSQPNEAPALGGQLRFYAKGPVGNAVLTSAVDSGGLDASRGDASIWTGDMSSQGSFEGAEGWFYSRLEQGLSYVQYARGAVPLESELTPYTKSHRGIQGEWHGESGMTWRAFYANEPQASLEEIFPGDGTGYYRLSNTSVARTSEQLSIIVRDVFAPHDVIREMTLPPGTYRIDYRTGQIFLSEPLPATDAAGNRLALRVRYTLEGTELSETVAGIQAIAAEGPMTLRAMVAQGVAEYGVTPRVLALGGEGEFGEHTLIFELAWSSSAAGKDIAYLLGVSRSDWRGWSVGLTDRGIGSLFAPLDPVSGGLQKGRLTSLRANRSIGGAKLTLSTSVGQQDRALPWTSESAVGLSWRWGATRPELELKVSGGEVAPTKVRLASGIGIDLRKGSLSLKREQSVLGDAPTRDTIEGRYNLFERTALQLALESEQPAGGAGSPRRTLSWSLTQGLGLGGPAAQTTLKTGYELSTANGVSGGAMVYGVASQWTVGTRNTISLSLDHKRPVRVDQPSDSGGALSWTYRINATESEVRIDRRTSHGSGGGSGSGSGSGVKQSIQWRASHPFSDALNLRLDALWSIDEPSQKRSRLGLSGAYRGDHLTILGSIASDRLDASFGQSSSLEWFVKGAYRVQPHLAIHAGYALRQTTLPSTTDKMSLGAAWNFMPQTALHVEGSLLQQRDTGTAKVGSMLGVSREISPDVWLTLGYGINNYVGFDSLGSDFSRTRSGLFVEVGFVFDEQSVTQWFSSLLGK